MHGVQPGEFGGRVEDLTPLIHSEDRPQVERAIQDALEHGSHYQVLLRAVHPDGQVRWLETTGQVIRNEEGRPVRMLGATTDATDRVRAEAEMRQQAKQLQISNADLERFAFAASHDLQEPLRMVTIYSQLLRRRIQDSLDEDSRQFIEIILDSTTRMRRLIEDLLEYSQVTHEQRTVTRVDASAVMKQVLLNCEIAIKESGATIDCAALPTVQVRQSQLVQVFQNLVINAIRYRSAAPPHIQIAAERRTREWVFSVRDNGVGIPPQQQTRVFELFKRLDSKSPGTGIGLALCQRIIDGHGGRIWVESEVGQGSTFYFTLPDPADIPAAVTPQRAAQPLGG
jgi:PAS domain S-box-containing protein